MLLLEDAPQGNISKGPATSGAEMYAAMRDDQLYDNGSIMKQRAVRKGWEDKLASIEKASGQKITLPLFDGVFMPTFGGVDPEQMQQLQLRAVTDYRQTVSRIEQLAQQYPEYYEKWMTDPETAGHEVSRAADKRLRDVSGRNQSMLNSVMGFGGAFVGGMQDPINLGLAPFGMTKAVGQGAYQVVRAGVINGLIGAAGEAAIQPLSQQWRKEAGLKYGWGEAAKNVGMAFAFGFGIDAGVRGAWRGGKLLKGKIDGKPSQAQADAFYGGLKGLDEAENQAQAYEIIEAAAGHLPGNNPLHKALLGKDYKSLLQAVHQVDPDQAQALSQARAEYGDGNAAIADDELRGAANFLEGEDGRAVPEGLHAADDTAAEVQAQRHVTDQDEPPAVMPKPQKEGGQSLQDGARHPLPPSGTLEGKPYTSQQLKPSQIQADAKTFQFKEGGDGEGVTSRLGDVGQWNPAASGKTMIFQRNNGDYIIADGHQRLGLAKRLARQGDEISLDAMIFKESDGWTPKQVREQAAKKNIQEGSGTALDYARLMRSAPELIDNSVPQNSAKMTHAKGLANLSDDAFGLVINEIVPENHAALVGRLVADQELHVDILQQMAKADLSSEAQARIFIGQALQAGHEELTQMTLFGEETAKLSLLPARTKILSDALKNFKQNKRLLAAINDNAAQVEAVGNKVNKDANAQKSLQSAQMAELVEKLASTHGPVSDALRRAAHMMAHDDISVTKARKIFMEDVEELYSKQGLEGLINPKKPDDLTIEPGSPEAENQGDLLAARFDEFPENAESPADFAAIVQRLPEPVRAELVKVIDLPEGAAKSVDAAAVTATWDRAKNLIQVAMHNADPAAKLRHEEIHALRDLGLFTDREWKVLLDAGQQAGIMAEKINGDMTRQDLYGQAYAGRSDLAELLNQEVVAHLAERRKAGEDLGQQVNTILDKLLDFLRKTGNALRGMGFQTAEDVFRRIESGEIGRRTQNVQGQDGIAYSLEPAPTFYSNLTRGIEAVKQNKAPAKQWQAMISKMPSISKDELEWNGVLDWLGEQKGSVSKQDVADYIKQNEIVLRKNSTSNEIQSTPSRTIFDDKIQIQAGTHKLYAQKNEYDEYNIYHPAADPDNPVFDMEFHPDHEWGQEEISTYLNDNYYFFEKEYAENTQKGGDNYTETTIELVSSRGENFDDQHFGPNNTIAHIRHKDRITAKGENLLYLEEVQSDWHNSGADIGYNTASEKSSLIERNRLIREENKESNNKLINQQNDIIQTVESVLADSNPALSRNIDSLLYNLERGEFAEAKQKIDSLEDGLSKYPEILVKIEKFADQVFAQPPAKPTLRAGVSDAPFKGDRWMEMSLKKMLRHAVDNGYEAISWNRGAQIADVSEGRFYNLPKQISWKSDGKKITLDGVDKPLTLKEIEQGISPQLAADIFNETKAKKISGIAENKADYKLPSEGFRLEYDQKIPRFLNKFTKKWGGKVEFEILPDFADTNTPNGVLRITDEMRKSVKQGMAYSLEPRRSQDLSRQKGEDSQSQTRANTRSAAVPRGQGRNDSYNSADIPPGIESLDIQSSSHLKNDEFLIDDGGSWFNKLSSLVGLGQKIVAKYPETFNGEAFRSWFGGSKVVTKSNEPLILYHSTNAEFETFRPGTGDLGMHFGTSQAASDRLPAQKQYAKEAGRYYKEADQILPVVLSIKNPLHTEDYINWHAPKGVVSKDVQAAVMSADKDLGKRIAAAEKYKLHPNNILEIQNIGVKQQADIIRADLQRQGYDGIVYTNAVEGRGSKSYIAFEPTQIKSLFNRGTFDGSDPRITYSIDPEEALDGVRKALAEADQALGKGGRSAQDQAELDQLAKDAPWEDKPGAEGAGQQPQSQNLDDFLNQIGQEFAAKSGLESAVRIEQIRAKGQQAGLDEAEIQQAVEQIMRSGSDPVSLPGQRPEATPEAEPNFRGTPEEQAAKRAQYIEQKRRAVLTLVAAQRVKADMMRHKNAKGQHDMVAAALSHMENFGTAKHSAIAQRETEILGQAMTRMSEFAREFERTKLMGVTPKQKMGLLHDIIRESFGEKTGNLQAEKMATAWFQTHEGLRGRFNRAGGMIGKMDKWGLPQSHDQMAVSKVTFQDWFDVISPLLDRNKTVHHITGQRMNDQQWHDSLQHIYETIVTNGQNTRQPSLQVQGSGALYKQGSEARFLNFKNADDWLKYAEQFGNVSGTHGADLGFHSMMRHLQGFSRDIAAMEILGPNPAAMQNYMRGLIEQELGKSRLGQASALPVDGRDEQGRPFVKTLTGRKLSHDDYVGRGLKKLDDHFDIARGVLDSPVDQGRANFGKAVRNWQVATKLGSATLSAIGDIATFKAALKFAGMKNQQLIIKDIFKYIQAEDRHFAVRSGLILDSAMSMVATETRFGGAVEAATRTGKIADRTLAWSGLGAWTQAIKHAFGMETMANFARVRDLPFDQLDPKMRRLFDNYGLEPGQWDLLRSFGTTEHKGVKFLRGVDISKVIDEARPYLAALREAEKTGQLDDFMARPQPGRGYFDQLKGLLAERQKSGLYQDPDFNVNLHNLSADILAAKQKYMEMIHAETEYAVPTGTIASQAITKKFQAGTPEGETWRLFFQFKAYPISILMMQGGRTMRLVHGEGAAAGAKYAASTFMAMTLAGGVIGTWLKDLKAGRDPDMDFTSQKNWGRWMAQGGGIGIMGDFLFSDHNRFGGGPLSTFAGPAFGEVEKVLRATAGNAQKLLTGKDTSFAKDALGIVRSNTPAIGSLWYTATAYNRVLLDQMNYLVDPSASKAFRRRMKKRETEYGQQYFWPLGDTSPARAPSGSSLGETFSFQ